MDDDQRILRPRKPRGKTMPEHNIGIYFGEYACRDAADDFNSKGKVTLLVTRNYWNPASQGE